MTRVGNFWADLRAAASEFAADRATRAAAALAFYTALSLAPLLVLTVALVGYVYGGDRARGELVHRVREAAGPQAAGAAETLLDNSRPRGGGLVATLIGAGAVLAGATGVFAQLQDALDTVWNVPPDGAPSGVRAAVRDRLLAFAAVVGVAALLVASLVLSAVLNAVGPKVDGWLPGGAAAVGAGNLALSAGLTFGLFALVFKILPHVDVRWADVWAGAALTTVLFVAGKHLIGLYLGTAAVTSPFGAAGSFVALLIWLYYSSAILLYGAEFTQVYSRRHAGGGSVGA